MAGRGVERKEEWEWKRHGARRMGSRGWGELLRCRCWQQEIGLTTLMEFTGESSSSSHFQSYCWLPNKIIRRRAWFIYEPLKMFPYPHKSSIISAVPKMGGVIKGIYMDATRIGGRFLKVLLVPQYGCLLTAYSLVLLRTILSGDIRVQVRSYFPSHNLHFLSLSHPVAFENQISFLILSLPCDLVH